MQVASGMRAGPGGDSRSRTDACIPEPADGIADGPDRDAITCAALALRRLAVLT